MGNAVPLPLAGGFCGDCLASQAANRACNGDVVSKGCDQGCVLMHDADIIGNSFRTVNPEELAVAKAARNGQNFRMKGDDALPQSYLEETARRCRATRQALGYRYRPGLLRDLMPYADDAEIERRADRVRKYEDGETEPGAWYTGLLKRFKGVGADWILHADPRAIDTDDLRRKIEIAMHEMQ